MLVLNRKKGEGIFIGELEFRISAFVSDGILVKIICENSILGPDTLFLKRMCKVQIGFADVTLIRIQDTIARIGIDAPLQIKILRSELRERNERHNRIRITSSDFEKSRKMSANNQGTA